MTEQAGLRSGPDRGQAGPKPEAAGLVAGPVRVLSRVSFGNNRPAGRFRPTPRPGHGDRVERACEDAGGDHGRETAEREGERAQGESQNGG